MSKSSISAFLLSSLLFLPSCALNSPHAQKQASEHTSIKSQNLDDEDDGDTIEQDGGGGGGGGGDDGGGDDGGGDDGSGDGGDDGIGDDDGMGSDCGEADVVAPVGQRDKAVAITQASPPGSVGAAISKLLSVVTGFVGNFAAGNVGDFYQSQQGLLNSPATDANIAAFANAETAFFQTQAGAAGLIGGAVSADARASAIRFSRDFLVPPS